jgi:hypothetical protein
VYNIDEQSPATRDRAYAAKGVADSSRLPSEEPRSSAKRHKANTVLIYASVTKLTRCSFMQVSQSLHGAHLCKCHKAYTVLIYASAKPHKASTVFVHIYASAKRHKASTVFVHIYASAKRYKASTVFTYVIVCCFRW